MYGDGSQSRSFCYVDDTVEAIIRMSELDVRPETPVNVGNPNEITMMTLSTYVLRICNSKSSLISLPLPIDDPKQRCPEISLAKHLLDWTPSVDLEVGLKKTSDYFLSVL
jgi:UDP-glucuronate decarboxylase